MSSSSGKSASESFRFSFAMDSSGTDIVYGSGSEGMMFVTSEVDVGEEDLVSTCAKIQERYNFHSYLQPWRDDTCDKNKIYNLV